MCTWPFELDICLGNAIFEGNAQVQSNRHIVFSRNNVTLHFFHFDFAAYFFINYHSQVVVFLLRYFLFCPPAFHCSLRKRLSIYLSCRHYCLHTYIQLDQVDQAVSPAKQRYNAWKAAKWPAKHALCSHVTTSSQSATHRRMWVHTRRATKHFHIKANGRTDIDTNSFCTVRP